MSAPRPHSLADLSLAPVLIELERGLDGLRRSHDIEFDLALYLNDQPSADQTAADRAAQIRRYVVRDHDLHGWTVTPTPDCHGLAVEHGDYKVSLMFGKKLLDYIER